MSKESLASVSSPLIQRDPPLRCGPWCPRWARELTCYDMSHSLESASKGSWRESLLACYGLTRARNAGRNLFAVTIGLPRGAGVLDTARGVAELKRAISNVNRTVRLGLQYRGVLHPRGRRGGSAHLHLAVHVAAKRSEVSRALKMAAVMSGLNPGGVWVAPLRSPEGWARYLSGRTAEHRGGHVVLARGLKGVITSHNFFPRGGLGLAWLECDPNAVRRSARRVAFLAKRARARSRSGLQN